MTACMTALYKDSQFYLTPNTNSPPHSITTLWPVLSAPTHGWMARLSWPEWSFGPIQISRTRSQLVLGLVTKCRLNTLSPIPVLIGLVVGQLRWCDKRRYQLREWLNCNDGMISVSGINNSIVRTEEKVDEVTSIGIWLFAIALTDLCDSSNSAPL